MRIILFFINRIDYTRFQHKAQKIMTTRANLYVDQGVDFLVTLHLNSSDNTDLEISDQKFYCDVRKVYSSALAFRAELTVTVSEEMNEVSLFINPETTRSVAPGKYQYDVIMVGNNKTLKLLEGLMFILPTMTIPVDLDEE